jgi:hypothetical protein
MSSGGEADRATAHWMATTGRGGLHGLSPLRVLLIVAVLVVVPVLVLTVVVQLLN